MLNLKNIFGKRLKGRKRGYDIDGYGVYERGEENVEISHNNTLEKPLDLRGQRIILSFITLVLAVFIVRLWGLQIVNGDENYKLAERNKTNTVQIFPERGIIYDRNGDELAWNLIGEDSEFARRKYTDIPGFGFLGYVEYPKADSNGFYWRNEISGVAGMEKLFDDTLSGELGVKLIEKDVGFNSFSENVAIPPKDGENIELAIDAVLQEIMYNSIKGVADIAKYKGGAGALMNNKTGEIYALVSYPTYNPNIMVSGDGEKIAHILDDPGNPMLMRPVNGLYTPGSIVKPFLALAGLDLGIISEKTKVRSTGYIEVPNKYNPDLVTRFRDWKEEGHGVVDVKKAIAESVNTFFYAISGGYGGISGMGIKNMEKYLSYFGFGKKTGIELYETHEGIIPSPDWKKQVFGEGWRLGDTYITSIGQFGFQVTPMQVLKAISIIANNGKIVTPTILKSAEGEVKESNHLKNIDIENFEIVREGMRMTVTDGTAKLLNFDSVEVAGKTGTAQVGYNNQFINSWITGFFPYENPEFSFVVVMERGDKEKILSASWVMRDFFLNIRDLKPELLGGDKLKREEFEKRYAEYKLNTDRHLEIAIPDADDE